MHSACLRGSRNKRWLSDAPAERAAAAAARPNGPTFEGLVALLLQLLRRLHALLAHLPVLHRDLHLDLCTHHWPLPQPSSGCLRQSATLRSRPGGCRRAGMAARRMQVPSMPSGHDAGCQALASAIPPLPPRLVAAPRACALPAPRLCSPPATPAVQKASPWCAEGAAQVAVRGGSRADHAPRAGASPPAAGGHFDGGPEQRQPTRVWYGCIGAPTLLYIPGDHSVAPLRWRQHHFHAACAVLTA